MQLFAACFLYTTNREINVLTSIKETFTVKLAMDSKWGYEGSDTVTVTNIMVETFEDDNNEYMHDYKSIGVEHDADWSIYTDTGFERAISERLGFNVTFTEQGLQEDGYASMEN